MIADGTEIHTQLAVSCGNVTGFLFAVGAGGVDVKISAVRTQGVKIFFERIEVETAFFDDVSLVILFKNKDVEFLFTAENGFENDGFSVKVPIGDLIFGVSCDPAVTAVFCF